MEKEFVTYEQSLALKELGYKEYTFAYYDDSKVLTKQTSWKGYVNDSLLSAVSTPLKQQALKWFRDTHGLYVAFIPEFYSTGINFNWQILWYAPKEKWTKHFVYDGTGMYGDNNEYPTQEEAESGAINKMIEIVKIGKDKYSDL